MQLQNIFARVVAQFKSPAVQHDGLMGQKIQYQNAA